MTMTQKTPMPKVHVSDPKEEMLFLWDQTEMREVLGSSSCYSYVALLRDHHAKIRADRRREARAGSQIIAFVTHTNVENY